MTKHYYCGYFQDRPHVSMIDGERVVLLFMTKKDAMQQGFSEVRKVRIEDEQCT